MFSKTARFCETSWGRRGSLLTFFLTVAFLFSGACSSDFNRSKFENVRKAASTVRTALESGAGFDEFSRSVTVFSSEVSQLRAKVNSARERELYKKYSDLLNIFEDGLLLWKYKIEGTHYGFIPKGVIYVGQDVEPIVAKYRFRTESHTYLPTGQVWKSIPEDSMQVVWENARFQAELIKNSAED